MNNLHRELAPISDSAWAQIEEETSRTLKRYLAGRRVVDLKGPAGTGLSAAGTGHLRTITAPAKGIVARQREVKALVELRVPFELDRQAIDDVDRGANDSDWQPAKDAARQIAFAEDAAIFEGYAAAGIGGIRQGTSNPIMTLPGDVREYPYAIAQSLSRLRLVGVNGPYAVLLGADAYTALAEHYGCFVLPTRPRKPRDKAKVETGVLIAERRIIARLRKRTFFSLAEVRVAVAEQVRALNERPFQKLPGSRTSVFLTEELPALRPLPSHPYEHQNRKNARVHIDYHVELLGHRYSVPHRLAGEKVEVRYTEAVVEIFSEGLRVASHVRSFAKGGATTDLAHMPPKHRGYAEWSPERFQRWARTIGPETERLISAVLERYPHPALGYRSCLGILRLEQRYTAARLEQAAARTLAFGGASYKSVSHVLKAGLDREAVTAARSRPEPLFHENLRGPDYFKS